MKSKIAINKALCLLDDLMLDGKRIIDSAFVLREEKTWQPPAISTSQSTIVLGSKKNPRALFESHTSTDDESRFMIAIPSWVEKVNEELKNTFEDVEPSVRFMSSPLELSNISSREYLIKQMKILGDIYRELEKQAATPLHYVHSKSCLMHYDAICDLGPNTNERYLCKYMFENHDFEEEVDVELIYKNMHGDTVDFKPSKVKSWATEVNRKTNPRFGFSVFKTPRGSIVKTYRRWKPKK